MDHGKAIDAAELLERVASGGMEASAALDAWPQDIGQDDLLDASWHDLSHCSVDVDVRAKDARYAKHQVSVLLSPAKQIREKYGPSDGTR